MGWTEQPRDLARALTVTAAIPWALAREKAAFTTISFVMRCFGMGDSSLLYN